MIDPHRLAAKKKNEKGLAVKRAHILSRRSFLGKSLSGVAAGAFGPQILPASVLGRGGATAPSNRITLGVIGLGGQGDRDMRAFLGHSEVQVVALCDVDKGSNRYEADWLRGLAPAIEAVTQHYAQKRGANDYQGCTGYGDFRELLARTDLDAVSIATPDNWHCLVIIEAAKAGKDIYCQKPLSFSIQEGRAASDAVRRHGRVFQCGSQRRSDGKCRRVCELVRNGRIGQLRTVKVGISQGYWNRRNIAPTTETMPIPESLDWDLWLGPAPVAPYNLHRCHFTFRYILDYSGGTITDWGAHYCDMAHWGMGCDDGGPLDVQGSGIFPKDGLWNAATDYRVNYTYPNGVEMIVATDFGFSNVRFEGSEGWLDLDGKSNVPGIMDSMIGPNEIHLYRSSDHYGNFLECIKTRRQTTAPIETAHRSITPAHLGNIAIKLQRKLQWDPKTESFQNDPEATRRLARPMRAPWHT